MCETFSTLLIVDDERLNLNSLVELFKDDYTVLVAKDGPQALIRACGEPTPDLILLDILMPDMDGFETCIRLKENPKTAGIPIIFITALHEEEDQVRGFALGAVDFITKPFMPSIVKARVKTHLALKSAQERLEAQNSALIEAAHLKEDVDRIMRHDLKGPLNSIIGVPQILIDDLSLDEEYETLLQTVEQSGYKMLQMINRSLDLYKMESGAYVLHPERVDLAKIARRVCQDACTLLHGKKIQVTLHINGQCDDGIETFTVIGEELLCHSMVSNLFQNAVEASPYGETIKISLVSGIHGVLRIDNQGAVPAQIRERFFEKYVTAGKTGGTGLGTYSAKLMATTMKGVIRLLPTDNNTTAVEVSLKRE
ncbi:response regulator [Magnetococcales bacterium HHB-1]